MHARSAAAWLPTVLLISHGQVAFAQADAHARAIARASCQAGKQSAAVLDARAALEREPEEIGIRMRLADALVDQGCYQEAVEVLEAGQESHPHNAELAGKLRDMRSLVTEQTYIEGLTQAAEGAKFQRNQLRCTRLGDVGACDDALKFEPDDVQLTLAKGDALMQANRPTDAVAAYQRASQLSPGDEAVRTRLDAAEAVQASLQPPPPAPEAQAAASNTAPDSKAAKRASTTGTVASAITSGPATSPPGPGATGAGAMTAPNAATVASIDGAAAPNLGASRRGATAVPTVGGTTVAGARTTQSSSPAVTSKPSLLASADGPTLSDTGGRPLRVSAPSSASQHPTNTQVATIAALEAAETKIYSNDAPPGRTN